MPTKPLSKPPKRLMYKREAKKNRHYTINVPSNLLQLWATWGSTRLRVGKIWQVSSLQQKYHTRDPVLMNSSWMWSVIESRKFARPFNKTASWFTSTTRWVRHPWSSPPNETTCSWGESCLSIRHSQWQQIKIGNRRFPMHFCTSIKILLSCSYEREKPKIQKQLLSFEYNVAN